VQSTANPALCRKIPSFQGARRAPGVFRNRVKIGAKNCRNEVKARARSSMIGAPYEPESAGVFWVTTGCDLDAVRFVLGAASGATRESAARSAFGHQCRLPGRCPQAMFPGNHSRFRISPACVSLRSCGL